MSNPPPAAGERAAGVSGGGGATRGRASLKALEGQAAWQDYAPTSCSSARGHPHPRACCPGRDPHVHPDAIEAFNPTTAAMRWTRRVPEFIAECGIAAVGGSDAHRASNVGQVVTRFPGTTGDDLRRAIAARETTFEGSAYPWGEQVRLFGRQTQSGVSMMFGGETSVGRGLIRAGGQRTQRRVCYWRALE